MWLQLFPTAFPALWHPLWSGLPLCGPMGRPDPATHRDGTLSLWRQFYHTPRISFSWVVFLWSTLLRFLPHVEGAEKQPRLREVESGKQCAQLDRLMGVGHTSACGTGGWPIWAYTGVYLKHCFSSPEVWSDSSLILCVSPEHALLLCLFECWQCSHSKWSDVLVYKVCLLCWFQFYFYWLVFLLYICLQNSFIDCIFLLLCMPCIFNWIPALWILSFSGLDIFVFLQTFLSSVLGCH